MWYAATQWKRLSATFSAFSSLYYCSFSFLEYLLSAIFLWVRHWGCPVHRGAKHIKQTQTR